MYFLASKSVYFCRGFHHSSKQGSGVSLLVTLLVDSASGVSCLFNPLTISVGRQSGLVVQRANYLAGGYAFDPEPQQPLSHSRDWCFTPVPGSGWQVLLNSQHGSIGS
jgi:hypothetical protein